MNKKIVQQLTEESQAHSAKALEHFRVAHEKYEAIKELPHTPERAEKLMQVLAEDDRAMVEAEKALEVNEEFLKNQN